MPVLELVLVEWIKPFADPQAILELCARILNRQGSHGLDAAESRFRWLEAAVELIYQRIRVRIRAVAKQVHVSLVVITVL